MPLTEFECKNALRKATDWLMVSDLPGSEAAREGIATVIPLVAMGELAPQDLDELASTIEAYGRSMRDTNVPVELYVAQLNEAITGAFEHVKNSP